MTARIPKSLSGPVRVERQDFGNGEIAYEIRDAQHLICTIYETDNKAAKAEAEFLALAVNNAIGALTAVAMAEAS